ncbi:MAG: TIGR02285 family protein [Burkholderiaceae bacterium]
MPLPPPPRLATALAALAALLPAAASTPARAQPVEQITWLSADPPPALDSKNPSALATPMQAFMLAHLPQVRQTVVQANAKRSWQLLAKGEQVCHVSAVRTPEREQLAYFTNTQVGAPLQLIVRRERQAQLPRNAAGEVDLPRLLADARLRGALVDGRSYGPRLDRLLAQRPAGAALSLYAAADFGSQIMPMLGADRADYTIDYDISLSVLREREPAQGALLVALPIQGADELMRAGVACPRTPWGLAAITAIDQALGTPEGAAMLRATGERWLTPELRQRYAARIEQFYRERARPSQIR